MLARIHPSMRLISNPAQSAVWEVVVSDLKSLRENWDSVHGEETLFLRATTTEESLRQWAGLQAAFECQLQQTATLFEHDRWAALTELQSRLQRLTD
jgi:hypothetical protein